MTDNLSFAEARDAVIATLARAADTLRRLPMPAYGRPTRPRSSWPLTPEEGSGAAAPPLPHDAMARPSARAISELDRTLPWLASLDTLERRLVWARAMGLAWPKLGRKFGLSVGQVRYRWNGAIDRVVAAAVHDAIVSGGEGPPSRSSCKMGRLRR